MSSDNQQVTNNSTGNIDHYAFTDILQSVINNVGNHKPAEDHEIEAVKNSYNQVVQNQDQPSSPQDVGNAAAARALEETEKSGGSMSDMIKMAMSEAASLLNKNNNRDTSNSFGQNQALQQAAMMAIKLFMSKQQSNNTQSGGNSGLNAGALLNMFMGSASNNNQQQQNTEQPTKSDNQQPHKDGEQEEEKEQQNQSQQNGNNFTQVASGLLSEFLNKQQ